MASENIVFFPKYTTLVAGTYFSDPFDVTGYKSIVAEVFLAAIVGTSPGATALLQIGSDLLTWSDVSSQTTLAAGVVSNLPSTDPSRYIRLRIVVSGTGAVATLWAKAVARDA